MAALPQAAAPLHGFARLLRRHAFRIAPEQVSAFMQAVTLLGPRSMDDIRQAALATLSPVPDRRPEFEAHFHSHFYGVAASPGTGEDEGEVQVKDDAGTPLDQPVLVRQETGGALSAAAEQLGIRHFDAAGDRLAEFSRALGPALPHRHAFRTIRTRARRTPDLRRSLSQIVRADGDVPEPLFRRRRIVQRKLLLLIDVSGSMKLHTSGYLELAHAVVRGADRAEVFTFGTRLTRITPALRLRSRDNALTAAAAQVEDWDGGTRIGPTLLAFLSVPRFAAFARGAAIVILSDALERGDHAAMETAIRRLSARSFRLSLCTPLAGDPRFRPQTAALRAILPVLDDLVDGSSMATLTKFILSLGRPAPAATAVWRKAS